MKESFFKIKTFKSLKEVMEPFFGIKNFKTVIVSFSVLKTVRVVRKQWSPFFSIKNFKGRKVVVEFSLSFKTFKSRQKVTVIVLFQWSRFSKLLYDDQISWSNIFSVSSH